MQKDKDLMRLRVKLDTDMDFAARELKDHGFDVLAIDREQRTIQCHFPHGYMSGIVILGRMDEFEW